MIKFAAVVGYGSFGKVFAEILAKHAEVVVVSRRKLKERTYLKTQYRLSLISCLITMLSFSLIN